MPMQAYSYEVLDGADKLVPVIITKDAPTVLGEEGRFISLRKGVKMLVNNTLAKTLLRLGIAIINSSIDSYYNNLLWAYRDIIYKLSNQEMSWQELNQLDYPSDVIAVVLEFLEQKGMLQYDKSTGKYRLKR